VVWLGWARRLPSAICMPSLLTAPCGVRSRCLLCWSNGRRSAPSSSAEDVGRALWAAAMLSIGIGQAPKAAKAAKAVASEGRTGAAAAAALPPPGSSASARRRLTTSSGKLSKNQRGRSSSKASRPDSPASQPASKRRKTKNVVPTV
jgi:hypothetical protein